MQNTEHPKSPPTEVTPLMEEGSLRAVRDFLQISHEDLNESDILKVKVFKSQKKSTSIIFHRNSYREFVTFSINYT